MGLILMRADDPSPKIKVHQDNAGMTLSVTNRRWDRRFIRTGGRCQYHDRRPCLWAQGGAVAFERSE